MAYVQIQCFRCTATDIYGRWIFSLWKLQWRTCSGQWQVSCSRDRWWGWQCQEAVTWKIERHASKNGVIFCDYSFLTMLMIFICLPYFLISSASAGINIFFPEIPQQQTYVYNLKYRHGFVTSSKRKYLNGYD